MSTRILDNLRKVEILAGLVDQELGQVAKICTGLRVPEGRAICREGEAGDDMYVIHDGSVRVMITTRNDAGEMAPSTIMTLYPGQCFGELVLLHDNTRIASVIAAEPTTLIVIREPDFQGLCDANPHIGYVVMRNLAQDLAYKLRASNLLLRGNIRWRDDELGRS